MILCARQLSLYHAVQHSTTQQSTADQTRPQYSPVHHNTTLCSTPQQNRAHTAEHNTTQHITTQHTSAQHLTAKQSRAEQSRADHSTVQLGTQRSTINCALYEILRPCSKGCAVQYIVMSFDAVQCSAVQCSAV